MNYKRIMIKLSTAILSIFFLNAGSAPAQKFYEEIIPAGNEYVDFTHRVYADTGMVIIEFAHMPDVVQRKIEQIIPGGEIDYIDKWNGIGYVVTKKYEDGHSHKIFVCRKGKVRKVDYMDGDYKERPGVFFVTGSEQEVARDSIPNIVLQNAIKHSASDKIVSTWVANSDVGETFVVDIEGFQENGVYAFAYRPDGILKTMCKANRMRTGVLRKWSETEIENLLGGYRTQYGVSNVINRIQSIPYDLTKGFRFVVLGDNRINLSVWQMICESMSQKEPLFVISTGDIVREGEPEQFDEYLFGVLKEYENINFLPTVGNHDIGFDGLALSYKTAFGTNALTYYFDYGNVRFIILDNVSRVTSLNEQLDLIEKWLATTPDGYLKFVFTHFPPAQVTKWAYHARGREEMARLTNMMTEYQVDHVFAGHIHAYSTATFKGIDYTVTGGGGAKLHEQYGPKGSAHHYVIVDVKSGGIEQQLVRFQSEKASVVK